MMSDMDKAGMSRREMVLGMGGLAVVITSFGANEAEANFQQRTTCTIKNDTSDTIFMKLVGHTNDWVSPDEGDAKMSPGDSYEDNLYHGERIAAIWDSNGRLVDCAKIRIGPHLANATISIKYKGSTIRPL